MAEAAFQTLLNLANLSRRCASGLPEQIDVAPMWSGVGFSCLGVNFVIPMGQVKEMMDVPSSTRLPGVKYWVVGLANVRGRLLPLIDLARFAGGQLNSQRKAHRVLVLETDTLYSGLIADRSFGMKHFVIDTFSQYQGELPDTIRKYITGSYRDTHGEEWGVFDLNTLAADAHFLNAAI